MSTFENPRTTLARAVALVRRNPHAVANMDAEAQRQRDAVAAEAKALNDAEARVQRALSDRVAAIISDDLALEAAVRAAAAEEVALMQLRAEHGVTPPNAVAMYGVPMRVDEVRKDRHRKRLAAELGLPWHKGRPASQVRSEQTAQASRAAHPEVLDADGIARRVDEQKAKLTKARQAAEQSRQQRIAERKAEARASGALR